MWLDHRMEDGRNTVTPLGRQALIVVNKLERTREKRAQIIASLKDPDAEAPGLVLGGKLSMEDTRKRHDPLTRSDAGEPAKLE
jgi:hypothetical protein